MKSIFDTSTRQEVINRITLLNQQNTALWGKMNVFQMVMHCSLGDDMFTGKLKIKRAFIGRLIGPLILKQVLKNNNPIRKNAPTSPLLLTTQEGGDLEQEKKIWISKIEQYSHFNNPGFIHPFFGPMTREQVGVLSYKHTDHHLRQFGV